MKHLPSEKPSDDPEIARLRLPHNRWQSFWDCLLNQSGKLSAIGALIALWALPLMGVIGISNIVIYDLNYQIETGVLTAAEGAQAIFDAANLANALALPALVILLIGLSGIVRLCRRLVFQEPVSFVYDFKKGLRENAGAFAMTGAVLGALNFLMQLIIRYGYFVGDSNAYDVALPVVIAAFVLSLPIALLILFQTDLYTLNYRGKAKNAFLLAMRSAPTTFLAVILAAAPWGLLWIPMDEILYLIVLGLLFLIVAPLTFLALTEYAFHLFDRFINKDHHPEIYDKGIYRSCPK